MLNSTSSNLLLGKQMLFVNFETQQVHSPNIRSGEFMIPDKKLILLRQVVFRDLNVDVLARIVSNDNDGYNDLVGTAATQKSLALTTPHNGHSANAGLDFSTLVDGGAEINISITKSGTETTTGRKKAPVIFGAGGTQQSQLAKTILYMLTTKRCVNLPMQEQCAMDDLGAQCTNVGR